MLPPELLTAAQRKGTDAEFRAFVQQLPSVISRDYTAVHEGGFRWNPLYSAGPYMCLPLTRGEMAIVEKGGLEALTGKNRGGMAAADWSRMKMVEMLKQWIDSR